MHPSLYHASGNHRDHCKPFNTKYSTLVYLQMDHCTSKRLNSPLTVYTTLLSPTNAKLSSFSYVHASKSLVYLFFFTANVYRYHSTTATGVSVILPINCQISPFLFYFSLREISKYLVTIMPFNNGKLNCVN